MQLEEVKEMNLKQGQYIEIRYRNEYNNLETRVGKFHRLFELPEDMPEIPKEFKSSYPIAPPFVEIAYKWDRNNCPVEIIQYSPNKIYFLKKLQVEKS